VTEYCWGAVWGREELSRKTRSMLNLAMLCELNRPHELRMHIKGALTNGVSREEIREVFLQVAIYCGVPAAVVPHRPRGAVRDRPQRLRAAPIRPGQRRRSVRGLWSHLRKDWPDNRRCPIAFVPLSHRARRAV
jgi:hypothetical protein